MANIKLRSTTSATDPGSTSAKGSALTHAEMDSNFILLNNEKLDAASGTATGTLTLSNNGILQLNEASSNGSNYVQIKTLASLAGNVVLTLPPDDGNSGEVLTTDGNGVLTWTAKTALSSLNIDGFTDGTGITIAGTDQLLISDGGTEKRINASQIDTYVSGTTSTLTNKTLTSPTIGTSIVGGGTNADILIKVNQDGATGNNGPQGNWGWGGGVAHFNNPVSIGTTDTAAHELLYNGGLQITTTHSNYATVALKQFSDENVFGNVWFVRSKSDTGDAACADDDTLGGFYASGYDSDASNYLTTSAAVYFKADGNHTSSNLGGMIEFETMPNGDNNASDRTNPLRIYSDRLDMDAVLKMGEVSKPTAVADHGFLYTKNDSGTAEVYVLDAADNETKISPHNAQGEWEYYSKNTKTGKTVRINMERLVRDLETLTGRKYIENE